MITCTLGGERYSVEFISGRALREIGPAAKMYAKIVKASEAAEDGSPSDPNDGLTIQEAMDTMVQWFCLLFGNQFTPDDVYDKYPVDRVMHDIALALMAVQTQTTEVLDEFPTKPVTQVAEELLKRKPKRTPPAKS
jgi:hypothetical protein